MNMDMKSGTEQDDESNTNTEINQNNNYIDPVNSNELSSQETRDLSGNFSTEYQKNNMRHIDDIERYKELIFKVNKSEKDLTFINNECKDLDNTSQTKMSSNNCIDKNKVPNLNESTCLCDDSSRYITRNNQRNSSCVKNSALLSDSKTVLKFSPLWRQTVSSSGAIMMTLVAGLTIGYSATLLPQLRKSYKHILMDDTGASWIASIAAFPMAPACLLGGQVIGRYGRRNAHYIICGPYILGWILIAVSNNFALLLIGRFITGTCTGFIAPLGTVFISETTSPKYRGLFLSLISLSTGTGIFIAHFLGTWIHWQWTAVISSFFPLFSTLILMIVPESPVWLISKGRIEDGSKAFYWFRGYADEDRLELQKNIENRNKKLHPSESTNWKEMWARNEFLKPLSIMFVFFVTCHFSGVNVFAFYSIEIIEKSVGNNIDHYLAMLIIDLFRIFMSVIACFVIKKFGRRFLCTLSGILTGTSMISISIFLYFSNDTSKLAWISLCCLFLYISAISIGLIPLPWIMCSEIFSTKYRATGSGLSAAIGFVASFVVVKIAPLMMASLGNVLTFLFYGICAFIGTVILYFILPETNKKSLQEIEDNLNKK